MEVVRLVGDEFEELMGMLPSWPAGVDITLLVGWPGPRGGHHRPTLHAILPCLGHYYHPGLLSSPPSLGTQTVGFIGGVKALSLIG